MFHNQKPPDYEGMAFMIVVSAPLMLGMGMAASGAPAMSAVLATWISTHLMMAILAINSRKK